MHNNAVWQNEFLEINTLVYSFYIAHVCAVPPMRKSLSIICTCAHSMNLISELCSFHFPTTYCYYKLQGNTPNLWVART